MKNLHLNKLVKSVLLFGLVAIATPVLADDDEYIYQKNKAQYITYEQAGEKAVQKVGGGQVTDVEFEYKHFNQKAYFDVEVIDNKGQEFDVRIDAKTGAVVYSRRDYND